MRHIRIVLFAVLYCSLSSAEAGTACPPVTRVGLSDLGYTAYREQGRIVGIAVDIANEMARRTGCKFEFHWYPRQRLFIELEAGNIDMSMGSLRLPERDAYARHLPYAYVQYDLILASASGRTYTSLSDFVEHGSGRLNVPRGLAYDTAIETQLALLASAGRLELVNDFETVFAKLDMGRTEGTIATPSIYSKYLKGSRRQASTVVIPLAEANPRFTGIYLSKKTIPIAVRDRYAATLKAMLMDQTIRTIYQPYFDEATLKRMYRQGQGPLLSALSAPEN